MRYKARYEAYKLAAILSDSVPPILLISLARCYTSPGLAPITINDAEMMVKKAIEKEKSIKAVTLMRGICKTQGREEEFLYWDIY